MALVPYSRQNKIGTVNQPDSPIFTSRYLNDVVLGYSLNTLEIKSYDVNAINNMIENILRTTPGERVFEPTFGSQIPALIFEPCDELTAYKMETAIFDALKQWMPYVSVVISETFVVPKNDEGLFDVHICYLNKVAGLKGSFDGKFAQN